MKSKLLLLSLLFFSIISIKSQVLPPPPKPKPVLSRILFIFDASQSMNGTWEKQKKITVAQNILINLLDSLEQLENIELAIRIYGHQKPVPPQDCSDSKLEVAFGAGNAPKIRQKLRYLEPKGTTPMASSLALSINDFGNRTDCRNIIILITDGIEACDGDPCAVARDLQNKGIALKPFVIGIGIDEDFKESFDCIGKYYNAQKEEQFKEILNVVITQALNSTTAQVNLLDSNNNPTESNVTLSFYDYFSGKSKVNYMHTINHLGNPDTLVLDPLVTYKLVVHTIPPVTNDSVKLTAGKHNIIAVAAPQGILAIEAPGIQGNYIKAIIRKAGDMNTLNYQQLNRQEKYITGKYDIEIPVLPKIMLDNVEVKQSHTTKIQVAQPGFVTFLMNAPGYGNLFSRENNKPLKWIYNLNSKSLNETVYLQPGSYTIVFRALYAKQTLYTITRSFDVSPGGSKVIELY